MEEITSDSASQEDLQSADQDDSSMPETAQADDIVVDEQPRTVTQEQIWGPVLRPKPDRPSNAGWQP